MSAKKFGVKKKKKIIYILFKNFLKFRFCTMTVGLTLVMGTFVSSYSANFAVFIFFYMMLFAFGNGMLYMLPIFIIARFFPKSKGKVTGVILGAYGLGALSSGYIVMFLTNPDNKVPV